jgi:predicted PurR-regulated permease PerM
MRVVIALAGLVFGYIVLTVGKPIIMPLVVAAFFAILLVPAVHRLEQWKFPRALAISALMIVLVGMITSVIYIVLNQAVAIAEDLPEISSKLELWYVSFASYLETDLGISAARQTEYLYSGIEKLLGSSGTFIQSTITTTANLFTYLALIPVYVFLMLYYRERFQDFFIAVNDPDARNRVEDTLDHSKGVILNYVSGLSLVVLIMAVLNVGGLLLIGIPYAVFFGIVAALLTIIPYVGIIIGSIPPIVIALIMTDSLFYPTAVIILFVVVQTLEGNFITPKVVGSKVSVNALAAMVALVIGGFLWGAIGMILSIPITGILKVILQQSPKTRPWALLLGQDD